jgi:hypothetical protein
VKRFISAPQPPPSGIEVPKEGKAKERREVGEGHDTIVVEDTSDDDDEDEETLQDRFQLRSRFSRPGLPHVPLVQDPPASLEASLAAPPRNPARKRVAKKLRVSETTPQEVNCLEQSSRVPFVRVRLLTSSLPCVQEVPPAEPVEEGDEGVWDPVGEPAGSRSPAPTVEEILARLEHQPPAPQGSVGPVAAAVEEVVASGAQDTVAPAAAAVEEAVAAGVQEEEAPAEGGLVDIASILGAPAVTIVRSNL